MPKINMPESVHQSSDRYAIYRYRGKTFGKCGCLTKDEDEESLVSDKPDDSKLPDAPGTSTGGGDRDLFSKLAPYRRDAEIASDIAARSD